MILLADHEQAKAWVNKHAAVLDQSSNPFAGSTWQRHFLDSVASPGWRFGLGDINGQALLLLFTQASGDGHWRALTNYYASQYSPFVGAHANAEPRQLVHELASLRPAPASVDMGPMSTEDADCAEHAFRDSGWFARRYNCFGNWYLPCAGLSFDAYMAARPAQLVNTWKRRSRKFALGPCGGKEGHLQLVRDPAEVAAAMQAYEHIYAKSWKRPEPYPGFVPGWALACAERGWLRLGLAWWGDVPVAAQFWFTVNRRAYIYKLAYDEAHAKLSAGTVLSAFLFQHALDHDRVHEIDYLTGDDAYKQSWVTQRRQRVGVVACNPRTWRGALRTVKEVAGIARQRLMSRSPAPAPAP